MKGIIIYKGKYGATRQYAEWLGDQLNLPVMKLDDISTESLLAYDQVIVGSSVYVGRLKAKDWIEEHSGLLQIKQTFFFIVCATPEGEREKIAEIVHNNIPAAVNNGNNVFILPGRMIMADLSAFDRFVLKMGARMQKDPAQRKAMLRDFDDVKPANLSPLLKSIQLQTNPLRLMPHIL